MGLIRAIASAAGSVFADSWRDYFYCESLDETVMAVKGEKRVGGKSSNKKGNDNIISNGSIIAVNDGQCMLIVDQGKVAEVCAEPGEFVYDTSTEPSIFYGGLGKGIVDTFKNIGKRFTFGGDAPKDQRVYFFNTKELIGNKYGTPNPVPFRVVDQNIGLDMDIALRCFGEYSFKITNPLLFYTNVCGNVSDQYKRDKLESQLKTELLTALQPAFGKLSDMGIRYSAVANHTMELADALNEVLSSKWRDTRGIEIAAFGVSSITASKEDEELIKKLQREAVYRNPTMAAAHIAGSQGDAMVGAANNPNGGMGVMGAFMGMNMAQNVGGMNAQQLFAMGQQQQAQQPAQPQAAAGWTCACGATGNTGKFCSECGKPQPAPAEGWSCECGAVNKGKFCSECGKPKPAGAPLYKCDKCGWEPEDPHNPPKFCPECGDPFDENDIK
ncbi:MAG: SPFH domain-containing protein [Firmicutes bacterium]|nr:SPFH domain-containing protein [Bacillota bacterium]